MGKIGEKKKKFWYCQSSNDKTFYFIKNRNQKFP